MCEFCETKDRTLYQTGRYCDLYFQRFGNKTLLESHIKGFCPKYQEDCSSKDLKPSMVFEIDYCPNCGRELKEVKMIEQGEEIIAQGISLEDAKKVLREEVINVDVVDEFEKLRTELHEKAEMHPDGRYYLRDEWIDEYIDNHIKERKGEKKL